MDSISSQIETDAQVDSSAAGLIEDDSLVEEISIDGMCGVY
ncbi:mycofactocin precursor MftA [Frondihabitans sucicola]|nr:mycofactocin precursor MftA [Frondihabitans sucicola]